MKRMLLAIMAVAVAISFSAPSFAGETEKPKDEKKGKKETHMIYAGEEKKDEKKKDEKKDTKPK